MVGWVLAALVALALIAIGGAALIAPARASMQYGIVLDDPRALAFLRAMAIRDVAIGILVALLVRAGAREPLVLAMLAAALVAVTDLTLVTADRRTVSGTRRWSPACWVHAAGAVGLLATALVLRAGR